MSVVHRSHHTVPLPPDVIHEFIELLTPAQATRTARVCKLWSDISSSVVWKGPVPLEELVRLLGPLMKTEIDYELTWVSLFTDSYVSSTGA